MNTESLTSINEIVIPSLNDPDYASDLNAALHMIKDNFEILSNSSFVRGADGSSISLTEMHTSNADGSLTDIGQLIKECIEDNFSEDELADLTYTYNGDSYTVTVFDNLYETDNIICTILDAENNVVSSMYYVFIDKRFAHEHISHALSNNSSYVSFKDASCVMVYNGTTSQFDLLSNAFPTMYYENGVGLCWKIYGNETQIPVQGVPGW